jgi:hypothetical protein
MNRLLRNLGFGLMVGGAVMILIWAIKPLRMIWPWLLQLPMVLRIGVVAGALGLAVLLGSVLAERLSDREGDADLRDEF